MAITVDWPATTLPQYCLLWPWVAIVRPARFHLLSSESNYAWYGTLNACGKNRPARERMCGSQFYFFRRRFLDFFAGRPKVRRAVEIKAQR